MIKRLRTKFIRIAMLSVALVLLALSLIVNAANFISTNRDLNQTLDMIYENQGTIPTKRTADTEEANAQLPDTAAAGEEQLPPEEDHTPPELEEKPDSKPSSQPDRPRGPFNAETPYSTRYFYLRFDADGDLDSGNFSHIAAVTEDDADTYIKAALQHGAGYGFYTSGYKFRVVKEGENRYIAVFLDCYQELRAVRTLAVWSGVSFAVCLALVYVLVVLLSRRAIDPVVKASEQQKQFITDAGHEIKTPLAIISANTDVLELTGGRNEWTDSIRNQTKRLDELVKKLLTLARMEEERPRAAFAPFCASDAVREAAGPFRTLAEARNIRYELEIQPGLALNGDEGAIRELTTILADNAVKYTNQGGWIRIRLTGEGKTLRLEATNTVEAPPEGDLNRLFDRFYRAEASRSRKSGGYGIGLSIAKAIAEAHKGRIAVRRPDEHSLAFMVTLPGG